MSTPDEVAALGVDFWGWRAVQQPRPRDDMPRLERPPGWLPRWEPGAADDHRRELGTFERRHAALDVSGLAVGVQVDARLISSALARVRWELDLVRSHERDPVFFVDQALGPFFDLLLRPPPFDEARRAALVAAIEAVPAALAGARGCLEGHLVADFARLAVAELREAEAGLPKAADALGLALPVTEAVDAIVGFREWLERVGPHGSAGTAVGRDAFTFFLREVALVPGSPEELLAAGRQEYERAIAFEVVERNRNRDVPEDPLPASPAEQVEREHADELAIRDFYQREGLLSQPASLRHYRNLPLPDYLAPLSWLGVTDELTGPSRLDADGVSYVPPPAPDLPYFHRAAARDPRTMIAHEGTHYQQLALSWAHQNPLRRHYYDSCANEGLAFYNEELMLQAGLFDDRPHSREVVYNFARLRALRVEVDIRLALGDLDVDGGARALADLVPMDQRTARQEAAFFAATPGQGMSYQVGKLQILRLVADASRRAGGGFSLRDLHDFLWRNGNVPLALSRWEYLGDDGDVAALSGR
jgi:hypothetical protein